MSWSEVKALNSDILVPLNEAYPLKSINDIMTSFSTTTIASSDFFYQYKSAFENLFSNKYFKSISSSANATSTLLTNTNAMCLAHEDLGKIFLAAVFGYDSSALQDITTWTYFFSSNTTNRLNAIIKHLYADWKASVSYWNSKCTAYFYNKVPWGSLTLSGTAKTVTIGDTSTNRTSGTWTLFTVPTGYYAIITGYRDDVKEDLYSGSYAAGRGFYTNQITTDGQTIYIRNAGGTQTSSLCVPVFGTVTNYFTRYQGSSQIYDSTPYKFTFTYYQFKLPS
jgi:hypothetical protein